MKLFLAAAHDFVTHPNHRGDLEDPFVCLVSRPKHFDLEARYIYGSMSQLLNFQ